MEERKDWLDYRFDFNNDRTGILVKCTVHEKKVCIPHIVAGYKIVDVARWAFSFDFDERYDYVPYQEIELSEGYRSLFHGAFYGCDKLEKVVLPSTLTTIYGDAFEGAENVKEIVFPNGNDYFAFKNGKLTSKDGTTVYFQVKDGESNV